MPPPSPDPSPDPAPGLTDPESRLEAAFARTAGPGYAWELLRRGARAYLRTGAELEELIEVLRQGQDYVLEELGFETRAGVLYVSLLGEAEPCGREALLQALEQALEQVRRLSA